MTYASIEEAWGGVSGSSMMGLPIEGAQNKLTNSVHPNHKRQLALRKRNKRAERIPMWKTEQDRYQCTYGSPGLKENCNKVFHRNQEYNQEKKNIANGYPAHGAPTGHFPVPPAGLLPQYPWYPDVRYGYLNYGPQVSAAFYNSPGVNGPQSGPYGYVKNQIQQNQNANPNQYPVPVGHYYPVGFFPGYYNEGHMWAPSAPKSPPPLRGGRSGVEHFTNGTTQCTSCANCSQQMSVKHLTIVFIVVLSVLAVILCLFLIGFANYHKTKLVN